MVGAYRFGSEDMANIFAYLYKYFSPSSAQQVMASLKSKLSNSGICMDALSVAGANVGVVMMNAALKLGGSVFKGYHVSRGSPNPYSPIQDQDEYVNYVILSWGTSPFKPIYHVQQYNVRQGPLEY